MLNTSIELSAVVEPDDTEYIVAWTSSDTNVFNVRAADHNGRTAVLEGVSVGNAELTVIIGSIVHNIEVITQPPSLDENPDLRQIYDKVSNIGADSVTFEFLWIDGSFSGRTSTLISNYMCNCEEHSESHIWFMIGAGGHDRCVFPEYRYNGNLLVISWPRAARRSYYLFEDGTGFFAEEDGGDMEELLWEFWVN